MRCDFGCLLLDGEFVVPRLNELKEGFVGMRAAKPNRKRCGESALRQGPGETGSGNPC